MKRILAPQKVYTSIFLYGFIWLVHNAAGCLLAMMLHLQNLNFDIESQLSNLIIQQVLRWNVYFCFLPILIRFSRKNSPLQHSHSLIVLHTRHLFACSVYSIATYIVTRFVVNTVLGNPPWLWGVQQWQTLGQAFIKYYVIPPQGLAISVLHYCSVVGCVWGIEYYQKTQRERLRAMDLERQLTAAQLDTLKMQLNPHFLFNTLNSVVSLIHENPDAAETMLVRLSSFLRKTLDSSTLQTVPLQEELAFVRLYTGIELVRFGDRLHLVESFDPATLNAEVPSMLLQPIIENAIRHGVADRRSGGTILLRANKFILKGVEMLEIIVQDDGGGLQQSPTNSAMQDSMQGTIQGIGLANTRERLHKLYGTHQSLRLENVPEGGVRVTMTIPFQAYQALERL